MLPSTRSILAVLPRPRLLELARTFAVTVAPEAARDAHADALVASGQVHFRELLAALAREELKAACRSHGLDDSGRARAALAARLLQAHGASESAPPAPLFAAHEIPRYAPRRGDIVQVRHRQWLVENVVAPPAVGHATLVELVCLDDDNQGVRADVLWELELGARVRQPEAHGLGSIDHIDPPRHFAAYLHALKWNAVTATDAKLFQAPFRAGIKVMNHQLTPLRKALALPRANVFIADDVGLGKTIEAGLIAQELLLRQRVDFMLVVCPASVCLQWRDEMQKRFGLHFEVVNREFIGRRRRERGFGVNPWSTHTRFIVSHPILRRPEYRDPLLARLEGRKQRSLLILDEAHVAAPASATRYAVDSKITDVIRDIAPRFENRLFLSATPHNGHSNSFSALLELLDPQRFTRGVKIRGRDQLDAVMVRRLKEDLRQLGVEQFPVRKLVRVELTHDGTTWTSTTTTRDPRTKTDTPGATGVLAEGPAAELQLAEMLGEYTRLMRPGRGSGGLVFVNLQKRLLSSVEAFWRTLQAHGKRDLTPTAPPSTLSVDADLTPAALQPTLSLTGEGGEGRADDDEYGEDDDAVDEADADRAAATAIAVPGDRARGLLDEMMGLAARTRGAPDAKVNALIAWMREHQCKAVRVGGVAKSATKAERAWSDTRVIVFTEYGDTKRYLVEVLRNAIDGTVDGDSRIMTFHGGMSDEQREEVQTAFNSPPESHPVRVLIATDAAREGVNLQGHCADLFHFDVPWNPARLEQRNGRIDRTMQSAPEVRCHYFAYPQRKEDLVLQKLVEKVDVIQRELGSIGSVLLDRMSDVMGAGIDAGTIERLTAAEAAGDRRATAVEELEGQRGELDRLRDELEKTGEILARSEKVMQFNPDLLRDAIDVGLELAGAPKLSAITADGVSAWRVPDLPESWQTTLDTLRPPRRVDEPPWEFRKRPPLPVVFRPPPKMNSALAQLHLQHPLAQRVLGRFLAQGFSAHDLQRVTIVRTRHDQLVRVIAFGRLSLFGRGATRLHDQLISVAARWVEGKEQELKPFADDADRRSVDKLEDSLAESPTLDGVSAALQARVVAAAPRLFKTLWPHVRDEADSRAVEAEQQLKRRGVEESEALAEILRNQRGAIIGEMERRAQLTFDDLGLDKREMDQFKRERAWFDERLVTIQLELEREPGEIVELYRVALRRLEPVGLVVLWPESRG